MLARGYRNFPLHLNGSVPMTKILGISGSLHEASHTHKILELALESATRAGAQTRLLDLRRTPLPLFNPDEKDIPAYHPIREQVLWADAFILATPDYHGSMSGTLKNFLDYYWHEFMGKLFGVIVASHEKGLTVQDQLRTIIRQCYGWSLPYGLDVHTRRDFDAEGGLAGERLRHRLELFARDLVVYGGLLHGQFLADRASSPPAPSFAHFAKY